MHIEILGIKYTYNNTLFVTLKKPHIAQNAVWGYSSFNNSSHQYKCMEICHFIIAYIMHKIFYMCISKLGSLFTYAKLSAHKQITLIAVLNS